VNAPVAGRMNAGISSAYRAMMSAPVQNRLDVFKFEARSLFIQAEDGRVAFHDAADTAQAIAEEFDLVAKYGQDVIQELIATARIKASPLKFLDMSRWDEEPVPSPKWAIPDRVPLNQAGLFSGEGGTGKSIIELMKNVAHVTGNEWLGSMPVQGPAIYVGAEDEEDELHIRLAAITRHYGVSFKEIATLHILCLLGQDATLCGVNGKTGEVTTTPLYARLYEVAGDVKPKNISIDPLSCAFAGNEIDRVQVYAFARHMQALAKVAGGSVTVLSHPSLAGINTRSGISGSTAWHGAFRFRQYLSTPKADEGEQPDHDLREFEFKKNQYGPLGATIRLRYRGGLFLPDAGTSRVEKAIREYEVDDIFLELLGRHEADNIRVSSREKANNNAPELFVRAGAPATKNELRDSMRRLLASGRIFDKQYGSPSRGTSGLAIKATSHGVTHPTSHVTHGG
jgi:RecA-family ATPase